MTSTFTLINASAGSGKTHTLTHQIADRIAQGLDPSQLIATTFTTKAAAELRDRVRRTLLETGQVDAARAVDSALISTVNSVSGELLREFALDAGISPDVQVLDEDRQKAAFRAAIDETAALAGSRAAALLARTEHDGEEEPAINVAIIGRPNAGKSSLTNCMVGANRSIVSDVAGTTRDAIDTTVEHDGTRYTIVDTAGLRRKSKIDEDVEYYSFVRAMRAIDRADVALLVIDASIGLTDQDQKVAGYAAERGCAMIIVLNKWDLTDGPEEKAEIRQRIADRMMFVRYAPVIAISALTGKRVDRIWAAIDKAYEAFNQVIPTNRLNTWLGGIREEGHTVRKGKAVLRMKYVTQTGTCPPRLTFFVNRPDLVDDNFERFLENRLRKTFDLEGTPVQLRFKKKD